jgi:hypothetical protein
MQIDTPRCRCPKRADQETQTFFDEQILYNKLARIFFFLAVPSDLVAHGLTPPDAAVHREKTRKPEKKKKNYSQLIWSSDPLHMDWLGFFPSWPQGPISNPVMHFF